MASTIDMGDGLYPTNWDQYVGQDRAKRMLQNMASAAKLRGTNLRHILIATPQAGAGKTALALLTIRESGRRVYLAGGKMSIEQVQIMFSKLEDGDVIFYDEIHKAADGGKQHIEWMLQYLEQGVLVTPYGREKVPAVTIIGATTDIGMLPEPIQQRFVIINLAKYTDEDGARIAQALSAKVFASEGLPKLSPETAKAVARATNNQPRVMRKLLESLRDLAITGVIAAPKNGKYNLVDALDFAELTEDGLTVECRQYLDLMYTEKQGASTGAAQIKDRLGLIGNSLKLVEQLLLDKELIRLTGRGRMLTSAGIRRAAQLNQAA